jgi:hypothetical protein
VPGQSDRGLLHLEPAHLLDDDTQPPKADAAPALALTEAEIGLLDHLSRANDPPPRNTVMRRGLLRITDIVLGAMVGAKLAGN